MLARPVAQFSVAADARRALPADRSDEPHQMADWFRRPNLTVEAMMALTEIVAQRPAGRRSSIL